MGLEAWALEREQGHLGPELRRALDEAVALAAAEVDAAALPERYRALLAEVRRLP